MSLLSEGMTHLERMCRFYPRHCIFTCGRKQWLSKRHVDIVWCMCFKTTENVYLIASNESQVVPLSGN